MAPVKAGSGMLTAGYIFSFLGGLIGIGIGAHLWRGKLKDSDGNKLHKYDEASRSQGKTIFFIGVVMMVVWKIIVQNM